jgi:Sulfotransferase family
MDLERRAFALRHLYVYPRLRLSYTYIPKNACTSFKRTFGRAQGWLAADGPSAHEMTLRWWLSGIVRFPVTEERIVVVRDPFDRVLSGYLNRFLMRADPAADHAMRTGLAKLVGPEGSRDQVTFADFVEYLSTTPSRRLNEHWRPQSDFLLGSYTRMIRFEHLAEDTAFLSRRGLSLAEARGHATSTIRRDLGPGWGYRRARRLRRLRRRQGLLPARENMYDDRLRAMVADRYAGDLALFDRAAREATISA